MKTLRQEYIEKDISSCIDIAKESNLIVISSKQVKSDEYYVDIVFKKGYFNQKIEKKRNIDKDLLFMLHLVHNFPNNAPKLFCLSTLSHIGIEICDGKNILENVIKDSWYGQLSAKQIILKIPNFIQECLENENNIIFIGKYMFNYEYDYNMLLKIPHQYFNIVEQIINIKTDKTEKRFLMITSLFFMVFSFKSGYFNYYDLKLVFFASVYSLYGINKESPYFGFEFNKNKNQRISLHLNIKDENNIMNILMYIFQARGVNYLYQQVGESNKLPDIDSDNRNKNNINNNEKIAENNIIKNN